MPSSLIFAGLVVLWLLILVPIVARRRQVVPRPSDAALAGRVLPRPATRPTEKRRSRVEERVEMELDPDGIDDGDDQGHADVAGRVATDPQRDERRAEDLAADPMQDPVRTEHADAPDAPEAAGRDGPGPVPAARAPAAGESGPARARDYPPPSYRRGRGGFDPEAAALAASARYVFRQRVVLALLLAALATGIVAGLALPVLWWPHGLLDLMLAGYLVYLRRQVRLEEDIRFRRATRLAGRKFAHVVEPADGPLAGTRRPGAFRPGTFGAGAVDASEAGDGAAQPNARGSADAEEMVQEPAEPALPPLPRVELPSRPARTSLVAHDDGDPALHDLDDDIPRRYGRAAG